MLKHVLKKIDQQRQLKNMIGNAAFFAVAIVVMGTFYVSDLKNLVVAASNVAATVSSLFVDGN